MTATALATFRERIARSPHRRGISLEAIEAMAESARPEEHAPGAEIVREGRRSDSLRLIATGEVALTTGEGRNLEVVRYDGAGGLFGAGPISGEVEAATATAVGPVETLAWDGPALERIFASQPRLREQLATRLSIHRRRRDILQLLCRSPLFRSTSPAVTSWLLDTSSLALYHRGEVVCRQGERGDAFFLIVEGEVEVTARGERDEAPHERLLSVLRAGDCFGEAALIGDAPRLATVTAARDATLLVVGRDEFLGLCRDSAGFRQAAVSLAQEYSGAAPRAADVVLFINRSRHDVETIATLVAQSLETSHGDRAMLVAIGGEGGGGVRRTGEGGEGVRRTDEGVARLALPGAQAVDLSALAAREQDADVLLCFADRAAEPRRAAELVADASTVIFLVDDPAEPFPYAGLNRKFVRHVCLGGGARRIVDPHAAGRRGALRLELGVEPAALGRDLASLPEAARAAMGRLGRAVTQREVGVALGGGGGWGWAHLPLLHGLHEIGVPVDLVAGVSFGAVVGACYASEGVRGLDRLLAVKNLLAAFTLVSPWTMWPAARFFDLHLPHRTFEELPLPLFVLAVEVLSGQERVFRRGNLGDAIRASCSLPGIVGPTVYEGRRYVDGCVKDNVPTSTLLEEGADFIIASNVVPAPAPLPPEPHDNFLQRALSAVSPLRRARDGMRSFYLQAHALGDRRAMADAVWSPDLSPFPLPDYSLARDVIEHARPQLPPVLDEIASRYRSLGRAGARAGERRERAPSLASSAPAPSLASLASSAPAVSLASSAPAQAPAVSARRTSLPRPEVQSESAPGLLLRGYFAALRAAALWFRYEAEGWEHVAGGPTSLIVGYHGRPFAWDLALMGARLYREQGYYPRTFTAKSVREIPFYREVAEQIGALYELPGEEELARMRAAGQHLFVLPGGLREAVRPFWIRYRIDFGARRGYLRFAAKNRLPIIPVVATGIDDAYLGLNDGYRLSHLLFGHGMYSLWLGLGIGGFYPFALPFPVKIRQRIGPRIDLEAIRRAHPDEAEFLEEANRVVVTTMQGMLDAARRR